MTAANKKQQDTRADSFVNVVTGLGSRFRDPTANTTFMKDIPLTDQALANLYDNALVRRIIDLPPEEAVKNWIKVDGDEENRFALQMLDDLNAEEHYANALRWDRLFGGAGIFILADDGSESPEEPLNENNLNSIEAIKVFDKREIDLTTGSSIWNDNPYAKNYGKPEWIAITPANGTMFYVHHTRLQIFDGEPLPLRERWQRNGWGLPVMQGLFNDVAFNDDVHRLSRLIMDRMSQRVVNFAGLNSLLETEDGEKTLGKRLQAIDLALSIMNTLALDKEDDFKVHNVTLTGVSDIIDRLGSYLSAKTGIPYAILFGRNTSGINANDKNQTDNFNSMIRRIQRRKLKDHIGNLVRMLMLCKNGMFKGTQLKSWSIEFCPLDMPTEKEVAEVEKMRADAKKAEADAATAYVNMSALDPREVRQKLAEEKCYPIDESLQLFGEVIGNVEK